MGLWISLDACSVLAAHNSVRASLMCIRSVSVTIMVIRNYFSSSFFLFSSHLLSNFSPFHLDECVSQRALDTDSHTSTGNSSDSLVSLFVFRFGHIFFFLFFDYYYFLHFWFILLQSFRVCINWVSAPLAAIYSNTNTLITHVVHEMWKRNQVISQCGGAYTPHTADKQIDKRDNGHKMMWCGYTVRDSLRLTIWLPMLLLPLLFHISLLHIYIEAYRDWLTDWLTDDDMRCFESNGIMIDASNQTDIIIIIAVFARRERVCSTWNGHIIKWAIAFTC